jgi:hypothetical protein
MLTHPLFSKAKLILKNIRRLPNHFREYRAGLGIYREYLKKEPTFNSNDKAVFIDIDSDVYHRYLYTFLKFFQIEGYAIYLPLNYRLINEISKELYSSYILKDRLVNFKHLRNLKSQQNLLVIKKNALSPDFFYDLLVEKTTGHNYHIPISQHPNMYFENLWNIEIAETNTRKRSILMFGNFDDSLYNRLKQDNIFKLLTRNDIYNFLSGKNYFIDIGNEAEFTGFLNDINDQKAVCLKRENVTIDQKSLRQTISKFDFFFALPGVVMPFSHNIIEAMSVGTIPFIQQSYADLFSPPLQNGTNAITFFNADDLDGQLIKALNLNNETISRLQKNVYDYYHKYLTPGAVVETISQQKHRVLYLQAEHHSVNFIKRHF